MLLDLKLFALNVYMCVCRGAGVALKKGAHYFLAMSMAVMAAVSVLTLIYSCVIYTTSALLYDFLFTLFFLEVHYFGSHFQKL